MMIMEIRAVCSDVWGGERGTFAENCSSVAAGWKCGQNLGEKQELEKLVFFLQIIQILKLM